LPNIKDLVGLLGSQNSGLGIGDALMMLGNPAIAPVILNNQQVRESNNLALMQTYLKASGGEDLTAIEKQLQAAGFTPGTPGYQAALRQYIFQSKAPSVTVYGNAETGASFNPPGVNTHWVNPKDVRQGYVTVDPQSGNVGNIQYIPGTKQPTSEEAKQSGDLNVEAQLTKDISNFVDSPKANSLFDLSGKGNELAQSSSWLGATARGILPTAMLKSAGINTEDPDIAKALGAVSELKNSTMNRLSGAAVSDQEAERIANQLPVVGQSKAKFTENLKRTKRNTDYLQERQKLINEGIPLANLPTLDQWLGTAPSAATKSPGMNMDEFNKRLKAYGLK
jgi:hypothetical protein